MLVEQLLGDRLGVVETAIARHRKPELEPAGMIRRDLHAHGERAARTCRRLGRLRPELVRGHKLQGVGSRRGCAAEAMGVASRACAGAASDASRQAVGVRLTEAGDRSPVRPARRFLVAVLAGQRAEELAVCVNVGHEGGHEHE